MGSENTVLAAVGGSLRQAEHGLRQALIAYAS
jgi:hypothetical protein